MGLGIHCYLENYQWICMDMKLLESSQLLTRIKAMDPNPPNSTPSQIAGTLYMLFSCGFSRELLSWIHPHHDYRFKQQSFHCWIPTKYGKITGKHRKIWDETLTPAPPGFPSPSIFFFCVGRMRLPPLHAAKSQPGTAGRGHQSVASPAKNPVRGHLQPR